MPYRSPFEHRKPVMQLETAVVVGPKGEEVYTDELNRIKVMFVWDRQSEGRETASCWMRVVQSDTGGGYGGVHIPRVGEEVLIGYLGGDCDRPIVTARVYNGATKPQWHTDGLLSGFRSKEYAGSGYNQLVMDDATGQNRAQLYSSTANSALHLGYLIEQSGNTRGAYVGSGFDLRSDAYGAVRASQGLYVTTHPKTVSSQPLDVREAQQQLVGGESLLESLSGVSEAHQADTLQPGQALNFHYPEEGDTAILIRDREGNYHAYGQKCTHLTCPVYYSKDADRLECPCHEGGFDVRTGNVLYGPPPRPLDRVVLEQRGTQVWATGIVRGGHSDGAV